jgi:hypothetical protein
MEPLRFEASRDRGLKVATSFILLLVAAVIGVVLAAAQGLYGAYHNLAVVLLPVALLVPALLILFVGWRGAPRGFVIDDSSVRIERLSGSIRIPLDSVREVRELEPRVSFVRVGGVGGFFGYHGEYRSPELGPVRLYATRSRGRVLIRSDEATYVVTPGSPERFVAEVRKRAGCR